MEGLILVALYGVALWFLFWIVIIVPRDMAKERGRDPLGWVLVSIFASPLTAIFLLWLVGPAQGKR